MKKFITFCMSIFMFTMPTLAMEEVSNETAFSNSNISAEESADNFSLMVNVTETTSNGVTTEIYTGLLSGYDNGIWCNVDFSDINALLIFDWNSEDTICITPIEVTNSSTAFFEKNSNASVMNTSGNLMPETSDISITSQIKINDVNVSESGLRIIDNANMNCVFSVSNSSDNTGSVTAVLATYTSTGKLNNVKTFKVDVEGGETENVEVMYQFDAENENTGKLMLWDSLSGMKPIRATINFSQNSGINAYYYNADNRLLQIDKMNGTSLIYTYDNMGNLLTRIIRE